MYALLLQTTAVFLVVLLVDTLIRGDWVGPRTYGLRLFTMPTAAGVEDDFAGALGCLWSPP